MLLLQSAETQRLSASVASAHEIGQPDAQQSAEFASYRCKRIFDIAFVLLIVPVALSVMAGIVLVLLCTGGNPIFSQRRVGRGGRTFLCYKFRSMVKDANRVLSIHLENSPDARAEWDRTFKLRKDPRVTRFGQFLRRSSLDELPQLFNVLSGDMSLVGPRPIVPSEIEFYRDKFGAYLRCRPGLTGLWQVSGRNLVPYDRRVRLDAVYARKQSLVFDLAILIRTIGVVISGRGAC